MICIFVALLSSHNSEKRRHDFRPCEAHFKILMIRFGTERERKRGKIQNEKEKDDPSSFTASWPLFCTCVVICCPGISHINNST